MTEDHGNEVMRAVAHFLAARRLRDKFREDPTLTGLEACARVHIGKAATFATMICDGAEAGTSVRVALPA